MSKDENGKEISNAQFLRWMRPVLVALKELGGSASPEKVRSVIKKNEQLSDDFVNATREKTNQNIFVNQVAWARQYLLWGGYLDDSVRGIWKLTEKGKTEEMTDEKASQIIKEVSKEQSQNKEMKSQDLLWKPLLNEYNPDLSISDYKNIITSDIIKYEWLDVIYYLYKLGGQGSCTQISDVYGNTSKHYNANAKNIAGAIQKITGCEVYDDSHYGGPWCILFLGKKADSKEEGSFIWKLREPLEKAICELDEEGYFNNISSISFDYNKLLRVIDSYKKHFKVYWPDEKYKWEAVKHFQEHWDINASDFGMMFEEATSKTFNLLANRNNFPREMIKNLSTVDDEAVREMFANLYDESKDLVERIKNFQTSAKSIKDKYGKNEWNNLYQTSNAISTYLWLRYPDKYYIYKYSEVRAFAKTINSRFVPKKGEGPDNVVSTIELYDKVREIVKNEEELNSLLNDSLTDECYADPERITMMIDIGFFASRYYEKSDDEADDNKQDETDMKYSLNTILYGPPGTGKTYSSVIYAVGICENKSINELKKEKYEEVLKRFNRFKDEGRIAFTTFHQSYGYEEFIEGIKPVIDDADEDTKDVGYTIEDGLFKKFCNHAMIPTRKTSGMSNYGLNKNPNVWKVSLEGTGDNPTRTECLENGHIRIGWDEYGEIVTDETDYSKWGGRVVLNSFMNKMQVGDIVLSCYSASTIDAIGVVTGDNEWHDEYPSYKRLRKVNWLAKDINYNIVDMNGGSSMTLSTVYKMKVSVADIFKILEEVGATGDDSSGSSDDKFVFIIDEINRGNISKIFGELITLIEDSKRIGAKEELRLELPYSKKEFGVPNNVYIIGTMNTADRSIALMDTALRRRFSFVEMMPDSDVIDGVVVSADGETIDVAKMLDVINQRIEYLYDREHQIGHAFFISLKDNPTIERLGEIFEKSVIPLLKEYFYDDYSKIQLVLGDNKKSSPDYKFIKDISIDMNDVFNGDGLDLDLPSQIYKVQPEALLKIQSYKEISKDL